MNETTQTTHAKVPITLLLAYAAPMVPINFSLVLFMSYISNYAIDVLLVPPTAMGLIFGAGRLWDAATDPLAGVWSDRTQHRLGRRRPWILASAIPIAVFSWMMWSAPPSLSPVTLIVWMTVAVFGFNAAMTFFLTPHQALGAELTLDHHQVSKIFAVRQAAGYVGMIGCLVFAMEYLMTSPQPREDASNLALYAGGVTIVLVTLSTFLLREPAGNRRRETKPITQVASDVWSNQHARLLLIMIFIEHTGTGASMVLSPFTYRYVLQAPHAIGEIFMFYVGASLLSLLVWLPLSRRIGKKLTWLIGLIVGMVGYLMVFNVSAGAITFMKVAVVLTGSCSACATVLGSSILADVIDADELETGERKEGAYYSAYTFLYKTSSGVMATVTGFALGFIGFIPGAVQPESVQLLIRSLHGLVPFGTMLVGAVILTRFALDESMHAEIRAQLDARRARSSV
jgi:GPH family glycoside/pentoside/hexuronide:cation symporter